jgi:RimJ/RimL family protein N-acetyltransferase
MTLLIAQHLREHFRYIGQQSRHFKCIDSENLTLLMSSNKSYSANYILGITSPDDKETRARIIEKATNLKAIPFTWFSFPIEPLLITELIAAGLKHLAPLTGISYDLGHQQPFLLPASPLKISIANNVTNFKNFLSIFERTWNHPTGYGEFFFGNLANSKRFIPFITHRDDEPVGSCVVDIQDDIAGCYWDCVLPSYRNQGIGTFMVQQRLNFAQENNCKTVVAQCLNSSLNIYLNLGFQKICDMALFRYTKTKTLS